MTVHQRSRLSQPDLSSRGILLARQWRDQRRASSAVASLRSGTRWTIFPGRRGVLSVGSFGRTKEAKPRSPPASPRCAPASRRACAGGSRARSIPFCANATDWRAMCGNGATLREIWRARTHENRCRRSGTGAAAGSAFPRCAQTTRTKRTRPQYAVLLSSLGDL